MLAGRHDGPRLLRARPGESPALTDTTLNLEIDRMMDTELAGVAALDAVEMASVAGGIDWGKIFSILYGEIDDIVAGFKDGYAAAG